VVVGCCVEGDEGLSWLGHDIGSLISGL